MEYFGSGKGRLANCKTRDGSLHGSCPDRTRCDEGIILVAVFVRNAR